MGVFAWSDSVAVRTMRAFVRIHTLRGKRSSAFAHYCSEISSGELFSGELFCGELYSGNHFPHPCMSHTVQPAVHRQQNFEKYMLCSFLSNAVH